jgi:isopenicillin-N epimerase
LTAELQRRGVDVLIDAAHGPGLLELDLNKLDAAYVAGNCHKWLCTPKGSGFLHVRRDRRHLLEPLTISHGFSSTADPDARFREQFDWQGTQDPTPWLCIPAALEFVGGLMAGGWAAVMDRNRALALRTREILSDVLGPASVAGAESVTAMTTAKLPDSRLTESGSFQNDPLMAELYERFNIRAIVFPWAPHGARYVRVSSALYNSEDDSKYFADALGSLL